MQSTRQLCSARACRASTLASYSPVVARVIQAMREHVCEPLALEEMAEMACLSPFHFHRIFRSITGIPPGEFFAALRLDAAKRLLLTTSLSVTDVCFEVGYASLGTFTTRFKELIGLAPLQLRRLADEFEHPTPRPLADAHHEMPRLEMPRLAVVHAHGAVSGSIAVPGPFTGLIFVGLFPKPIPQGCPVACTTLAGPGPFRLGPAPDGVYYLLGAALPRSPSALGYLMPEAGLLVGVGDRPVVVRGGRAGAPVDLGLRPLSAGDPPILGVFPPLLATAAGARARMSS